MKIETVRLDEISQDPANVRKHSERNIEAIVASLRAFGQQKVIVVDRRGIILAGNGTYEAAKRLGWESIKIHRTNLSGHQATLYAIADNKTSDLGEFDIPSLQRVLGELKENDVDLLLTGFNEIDIATLLPSEVVTLDEEGQDDEGDDFESDSESEKELEPSHVRMVQLFLDSDTFPIFAKYVEVLGERYGTKTATDTVMETMKRAYDQV